MSAPVSAPKSVSDDVRYVAIGLIDIPAGRRRLDPAWVAALADLFREQGQLVPIEVVETGERFRLVYGRHRLAAGAAIGWADIRASVRKADEFRTEADLVLREIAENLARRELSVLDKSVDIARWRDLYEAANGSVKPGPKGQVGNRGNLPLIPEETFARTYSEVAREALGLSLDAIKRAIRIARIPAELRERIALLPVADNQSELLLLAAEPAFRQHDIVNLLTAAEPARSVAAAIELLDGKPAQPVQPWQKVADRFSGLKERDQDRFFALHEGAVRLWLQRRGIRIVEGDGGAA